MVYFLLVFLACVMPAVAAADDHEPAEGVPAPSVARADEWVTFEQARDQRAQRAERTFYPLGLGLQAALGGAFAIAGDEPMSGRTRALFGVSSALAAGAMFPTFAVRDRNARRAWFAVGSAAFSVGFGAGLFSLSRDEDGDRTPYAEDALPWMGVAAMVQGLALLPIGFIAGPPDEEAFAAHVHLPPETRIANAARLLEKIDRYEQHLTAVVLLSNVLAAGVLGAGAVVEQNREDRKMLGFVAIAPIASALLVLPRLFVRPRLARFMLGQPATRLPLNPF